MTQINVCTANKQMHDKHKDSSLFPKQADQNTKMTEETDREQGKTKHEVPRSVNRTQSALQSTQNKNNIRTTVLERSVV